METPKPGKIRLLLIYRGRIGDAALLGKRTSKRSKNNWDLMCKRLNGETGGKSFSEAGAEANFPISRLDLILSVQFRAAWTGNW